MCKPEELLHEDRTSYRPESDGEMQRWRHAAMERWSETQRDEEMARRAE